MPVKLEATNGFFLGLVGAIQSPVVVKDAQLHFVYVNDAFCRLVKRTRDALLGRNADVLGPSEDAEGHRQVDRAVMADGVARDSTEALTDAQGNQITILTLKSRFEVADPSGDSGGRPQRYLLGVITDTTLQKRTERDLIAARIAAEVANVSKSTFLANMSHELRTPLNAIIGFSEIIKDGAFGIDPRRYQDYAADIFQSGGHLLKLINDILDISKIDAGKYQIYEENCDLREAVSAALLFVRDTAQTGDVVLHDAVSPTLPLLRADLRALTQVMTNLVANAVKFTGRGGRIEITAKVDDGCLSISVADTGIGMDPSDIPAALAPFQQLESAWERRYEGTGLGLPLTDALLKLHGGSLHIESELGTGTTVTARFPAERTIERPQDIRSEGLHSVDRHRAEGVLRR